MENLPEFAARNWYLFAALIVIVAMLAGNLWSGATAAGKAVSPGEAVALINHEDALVIDVRDAAAYGRGHILDALHVPLGSLKERLGELGRHRERPCIVYCDVGTLAGVAAGELVKAGFTRLHRLQGGLNAWQQDNLPLTRD